MIKFFRRIRSQILGIPLESSEQNLLAENKFSKYLIYAIGEIILVVIGILIALSINNWNEQQKNRQAEFKLLNGILENLNEDNSNLLQTTNRLKLTMQNIERQFDGNPIPDDSLAYVATRASGSASFIPITAAYDRGLNGGDFSLIKRDSVANLIQRLYSFEYETIKGAQVGLSRKIAGLHESSRKYNTLELRSFSREDGLYDTAYELPFNIQNLKKSMKDPGYKNHCAVIYENANALITFYQRITIKNQQAAKSIEQYVNSNEF